MSVGSTAEHGSTNSHNIDTCISIVTVCFFFETVQGIHHSHHRHKNECEKQAKSKSIEELRAERIRREQQERQRAEQLMTKMHGGAAVTTEPVVDDRQRRYNSQFNPDVARRPRPRDSFT